MLCFGCKSKCSHSYSRLPWVSRGGTCFVSMRGVFSYREEYLFFGSFSCDAQANHQKTCWVLDVRKRKGRIDDFLARRLRANKFAMGTTFLCEILIFQAEHRWTVFQSRPRMLATSWYQDRNFHRQTFPFYAYNAYVTELLDDTKGQNMRE